VRKQFIRIEEVGIQLSENLLNWNLIIFCSNEID
jgi:hypothetical protein